MKIFKNIVGGGSSVSTRNKGSFSLELIAIVVCVILVAVLALRTFGSQISNTTNDTTNTVETLTSTVLSGSGSSGSGGSGGSGSGGDPASDVDMSNINVMDGTTTLAAGDFSTKGNLVTINDTQYRVLAVDGTMAKVMSMEYVGESKFGVGTKTSFGSKMGQKYADSTLDQAMTTYYNTLPSAIQNAIVEQNINQSMYDSLEGTNPSASFTAWYKNPFTDATTSGTDYYLARVTDINVGPRKVYALDFDDVINYLGPTSTPQNVNEMFFGVRNNNIRSVWLRSADSYGGNYVFSVAGSNGSFGLGGCSDDKEVRPVFVLDLSLLS